MNREELETITNNNLEIQELNQYIKKIQEAYKQLEKENLELKKKYENAVADYECEKSKNQTAIEYMNEWGNEPDADMYMFIKDYKEFRYLLSLLKGTNERE